MRNMCQEKLAMAVDSLEGISRTLACVREAMEEARPSIAVDDYFEILMAVERINEAKYRLMGICEKREEGAQK